jgi:F0F1-type ATP synthase membrane subunit b/b'
MIVLLIIAVTVGAILIVRAVLKIIAIAAIKFFSSILDKRFDEIAEKLEKIDYKMESLRQEIRTIENRLKD